MANTISDIVDRIHYPSVAGKPSDDLRRFGSREWLRDKILDARADIIRQWKGKTPPQDYYQTTCCLKLACKPFICDGIDSGITLKTITLPSVISELGMDKAIRFFGPVDRSYNIAISNTAVNIHAETIWGNQSGAYATLSGNIATIHNLPPNVTGGYFCLESINYNPSEIEECNDDTFPVPGGIIEQIIKKVQFDVANYLARMKQDKKNDSNE